MSRHLSTTSKILGVIRICAGSDGQLVAPPKVTAVTESINVPLPQPETAGQLPMCFQRWRILCGAGDLPSGTCHIIVALVQYSVLLELETGPFDSKAAQDQRFGHPMGDWRMFSLIVLSSMASWFFILAFVGVMDFYGVFRLIWIIADVDLLT